MIYIYIYEIGGKDKVIIVEIKNLTKLKSHKNLRVKFYFVFFPVYIYIYIGFRLMIVYH